MLSIVEKSKKTVEEKASTDIASKDLCTVFNKDWEPTKKHSNPVKYIENLKDADILRTIFEIMHLKDIYRRWYLLEWRDVPVEKCESDADHCFGVAMIALILAVEYYPELDLEKVLIMAILHEIGEVYIWDLTPHDRKNKKISPEEKHELEKEAVIKILSKLWNGQKYIKIWLEFEEWKTPEAKFVQQMDKLEMLIQASIYKWHYDNEQLREFLDRNGKCIKSEELQKIVEQLYSMFQ